MCVQSGLRRGGIYQLKKSIHPSTQIYFLLMTTQPNSRGLAWFAKVTVLKTQTFVPGCNAGHPFFILNPYRIFASDPTYLTALEFQSRVHATPKNTLTSQNVDDIANCIIYHGHISSEYEQYLF